MYSKLLSSIVSMLILTSPSKVKLELQAVPAYDLQV